MTVPISQMRMSRLKDSSSYHIQGGERQQRVSAHGNSLWPHVTGRTTCCAPGIMASAGHPQLTSSWQVRMGTLLSEARTNSPEGLTPSEGDLDHPVTPHMTLLRTEQPPTGALRQVQASRESGEKAEKQQK